MTSIQTYTSLLVMQTKTACMLISDVWSPSQAEFAVTETFFERVCASCLFPVVVPITPADSDLQNSMRSGGGGVCICSLYLASPVPLLNAIAE